MFRISGGELFERIIDEDFELTEREVIKYMLQIIDGVNFIHKQGIVHLDLKPENIMCVNKTGSKIKLIDFGLARRLGNKLLCQGGDGTNEREEEVNSSKGTSSSLNKRWV